MTSIRVLTFNDYLVQARQQRSDRDFLAAADSYARAADLRPDSNAAMFAALCLRDAGRDEDAIAGLESYVSQRPDDSDGWVALGINLKRLKRNEAGAAAFRQALDLRDDIACRNALVSCLWLSGQNDAAIAEGRISLENKDRAALQSFADSPFSGMKLTPGGKGFDPERPSRNIIAFSLWGDRPEYVTGALVNAQIAQHIYVRWTPRFYCDTSVPADARDLLSAYGAQVVLMDRPEHQRIRPMWRFLASDDPGVNVFVCRDTDSRLNAKELLGVQDWLDSGQRFHIMRDHIYHHELILAGMWGGMAGVLPRMDDWLARGSAYYDNRFGDQAFLADMVWPLIRGEARIHDTIYRYPDAQGFPPGYDLPGKVHVGGGLKAMPHWRRAPWSGLNPTGQV